MIVTGLIVERAKRAGLWLWKVLPIPFWGQWAVLWLGNTKFLVGVVGVVFDEQERVLLLKHTYRNRYPWGLPGGWVGGREQPERALARELAEETGLDITVGEVFRIQRGPRRPQIDIYFFCRYNGGGGAADRFRPNAEIAALRFCPLDDLPRDMLPGQKRLLTEALARWRRSSAEPGTRGAE